jgi:prephenate dehydratase
MTALPQVPRVAFQGERGAFSEQAALLLLGEKIETVPRPTFAALFSAVAEGVADCALAPIENTLVGTVVPSLDLLLESGLHAVAEVVLPIALHLIGTPEAVFEGVTSAESHPVALAQCERFLRAHPQITRRATLDTAGSVLEILRAGDPRRAAIAGAHAAKIHGGKILRSHIEDHPENYTRFLLLSPTAEVSDGANKLSLVIELAHVPGALHHALNVFARRSLQLHKIESRPIPGRPWQYRFFLDLEGSTRDGDTNQALEELRGCTDSVRILGCYPGHATGGQDQHSEDA